MKRRTVNGYSENDISKILENGNPPKSHADFWEAVDYFRMRPREKTMTVRMQQEYHRQFIFDAQRHCDKHFGVWTQEDEEELEFVSIPFYGKSGSEYNPFLGMSMEDYLDMESEREREERRREEESESGPKNAWGLPYSDYDDEYNEYR